jgi:hypothetical protein
MLHIERASTQQTAKWEADMSNKNIVWFWERDWKARQKAHQGRGGLEDS